MSYLFIQNLAISAFYRGFLGGSDGKEFTCKVGDLGSIPGLGRSPGGRHGNPLQYSCLEIPHGQRSLAGFLIEIFRPFPFNVITDMVRHKFVILLFVFSLSNLFIVPLFLFFYFFLPSFGIIECL